jgi:DNA polymerase III sliding clamp (beta) subunit (PCNA family)
MTNKEILELHQAIMACGNLKGIKFAYALAKNKSKLEVLIKDINDQVKKLQEENAKKDESGKMIIKNNRIEMKDQDKMNKDYDELMNIENKDVNINSFHKIKEKEVPEDITTAQLTGIFKLIEE